MMNAFQQGARREIDNSSIVVTNSLQRAVTQKAQPKQYINRMSVAISNAGDTLTRSSTSESDKKHKNPKNLASGIGYGGMAFATGLFRGLTGIVYEPYKGARKKGVKGFGVGIGKGLVGVVAKPVGGTVGLVGCTVQGAVSTPSTIKKAVTKKKDGTTGEEIDEGGPAADYAEEEKSEMAFAAD